MATALSRGNLCFRALACGAAGVLAITLGGSCARSWSPLWGLFATLWIVLPVLAIVTSRVTDGDTGRDFSLHAHEPRFALAAALLAPALALLAPSVHAWEQHVLPDALRTAGRIPLGELSAPARVLLLAVSPAITEELFFRGALLPALRRGYSDAMAVALQALFFGAAHIASGNLVMTALLGTALGALTIRSRSLLPAILLHGTFNALFLFSSEMSRTTIERLAWLAAPGLVLAAWPRRPASRVDAAPEPDGTVAATAPPPVASSAEHDAAR